MYVVQISMIADLDFAFISELATRLAMILSEELEPFLESMADLFDQPILDNYLVGFRFGMLWKMMFDLKLTS